MESLTERLFNARKFKCISLIMAKIEWLLCARLVHYLIHSSQQPYVVGTRLALMTGEGTD